MSGGSSSSLWRAIWAPSPRPAAAAVRFGRLRGDLWRAQQAEVLSWLYFWSPYDQPRPPLTLFDFRHASDAHDVETGLWRLGDDGVMGGFSHSQMELLTTAKTSTLQGSVQEEEERKEKEEDENHDDDEEEYGLDDDDNFHTFVRWQGTLSTTLPRPQANEKRPIRRSGFCTLQAPEFPQGVAYLGSHYNAMEITCRLQPGRLYTFQLAVDSMIPGELYQGYLLQRRPTTTTPTPTTPPTPPSPTPFFFPKRDPQDRASLEKTRIQEQAKAAATTHPAEWLNAQPFLRLVLPLQDLLPTSGGQWRANPRTLDEGAGDVQQVSVTLMDDIDGNFCFDLARIRAVNFNEQTQQVVGERTTQQQEEEENDKDAV